MSVRDGLLAILTLGPAYGLQLHSELLARAPHRDAVNVGQIYGTLERTSRQGLIEPHGSTEDGLPLYRLTATGRDAAVDWMTQPITAPLPEWTEMLDQLLITSSVDPARSMALAKAYRLWWEGDLAGSRRALLDDPAAADQRLALLAREALGIAALAWLGAVTAALADYDSARALSTVRPKRGRRPRVAAG